MNKKRHSVIYASAYYRGLECLLTMWPKIREQVPDATLDVAYGWESWLALQGEDDFYHRMERKFDELKDQGVTVHGRLSHEDLASLMAECEVFAYPTEFPEIFAITAVKMNAAGCKPVITNVAALAETGGPNATFIRTKKIYSDEYKQEKFIAEVVKALNAPLTAEQIETQRKWAFAQDWSEIAKQWSAVIEEKLHEANSVDTK